MRSIRFRTACTYSTGETERARIKPATSARVRFSRFIFDVNGVLLQGKEVGSSLIDIGRELLGSALAELFDRKQPELRFYFFFCLTARIVSDNEIGCSMHTRWGFRPGPGKKRWKS